ncbi:MAG: Mrp/NBP35 family ATP-binding protein [[Clostridium] scindens]|uniref:Mrp/NBP35 family ATP-binding protein n=1 Tax=Clostridium scindens (strain JCM 10418 / VPI 12708) TaxID=29347 RepID=UPI002B2005F8|nr:Mrp/NBP35 family ATP-binding protein [[Clostridium] scindens]MEA4817533.1 Mrp/NBP35 family ATP-binding protein [[Clostridium] scindens]
MSCDKNCDTCATNENCNDKALNEQDKRIDAFLGKVKHKLMVMSGKGGVGKSTVAANLAIALSEKGYNVGLLDVDLHGPSIAGILGLTGIPLNADGDRLLPYQYNEHLEVMTVQGLLADPDEALIWRGPLKIGVIRQFLADTNWSELDYLIVDCPPGTGDEPLTVIQTIEDAQAVIVTTPQEVSLSDVRKSISFCQQTQLEILGIVENMSGFVCPDCGAVHNIFKSGGGAKLAAERGISFLGKLPIDPQVVDSEDIGNPTAAMSPKTKEALETIVNNIIEKVK